MEGKDYRFSRHVERNVVVEAWKRGWGDSGSDAVGGEGGDGWGGENPLSGEWDWAYIGEKMYC